MRLPVNMRQPDTWNSIEGSCLEVFLIEIDVHIDTSGTKVISSRHIGNDALTVTPN